jgi:hypothetical protein
VIDRLENYARHAEDTRPVRVALDTNVVGNLITGEGPQLDWERFAANKMELLVSLSDAAFIELLLGIHCGHVPWDQWAANKHRVLKLIDPYLPVMPGRGDALGVFGFSDFDLERRTRELKLHQSYGSFLLTVDDYNEFRGLLKEQDLRDLFQRERDEWAAVFDSPERYRQMPGIEAGDAERVSAFIREAIQLEDTVWNEMLLKIIARYLILAAKEKDAYNPRSKKRKGDFIDQTLCFALPLPAIVVTADGKFRTAVRQAGTRWSNQLLSVEEANKHVVQRTLRDLLPTVGEPP